jgi:hypothetical protein
LLTTAVEFPCASSGVRSWWEYFREKSSRNLYSNIRRNLNSSHFEVAGLTSRPLALHCAWDRLQISPLFRGQWADPRPNPPVNELEPDAEMHPRIFTRSRFPGCFVRDLRVDEPPITRVFVQAPRAMPISSQLWVLSRLTCSLVSRAVRSLN